MRVFFVFLFELRLKVYFFFALWGRRRIRMVGWKKLPQLLLIWGVTCNFRDGQVTLDLKTESEIGDQRRWGFPLIAISVYSTRMVWERSSAGKCEETGKIFGRTVARVFGAGAVARAGEWVGGRETYLLVHTTGWIHNCYSFFVQNFQQGFPCLPAPRMQSDSSLGWTFCLDSPSISTRCL